MTDAELGIDELLSRLPPFEPGGPVALEYFINENRKFFEEIRDYDPVRLAATFGGLLHVPDLQSSGLRIEALVHYALAFSRGTKKPTDKIVGRLFKALGDGVAGRLEDPAEDVFIANIRTPRGNFRILEGTWEAAGFNLQRFINALERVPRHEPYDSLRESVYALLRLADLACERVKLVRYQLGNEIPADAIPTKILAALGSAQRWVRFSEEYLNALGVALSDLGPFSFAQEKRDGLLKQQLGHSDLERSPIIIRNDEVHLVLPTAVSSAIRRYVIERMDEYGMRVNFVRTLADEFAEFFSDMSLLGSYSGAPLNFHRMHGHLVASISISSDIGRYLNFVFYLDSLESFADGGLVGHNPPPEQRESLSEAVDRAIDQGYDAVCKEAHFLECLTVFVSCGVGRGVYLTPSFKQRDKWGFRGLSAADLATLSQLPNCKGLSLWRLMKAEDRISDMGVTLLNVNGLLNMVGWARSLDGHLVPHGDIPHDFGASGGPLMLMIEQNAIRTVRHKVDVHWDFHMTQDPTGAWVEVSKEGNSLFEEDESQPIFVAHESPSPSIWPRAVYETSKRRWWIELERTEGETGRWAFERYKMVKTWLVRMVPVLERAFPTLPEGAIVWRTHFDGLLGKQDARGERDFLTYDQALASLAADVRENNLLYVTATPTFEEALFHPENIAEHALVEKSVKGFASIAGVPLDESTLAALVSEIVPDTAARQTHAFRARHFRDFVHESIWSRPVVIDIDDSALLKLGLGWRARDQKDGGDLEGKDVCTSYLNKLMRILEDEICMELQTLDRRDVIDFALNNHESAINERDNWRRTAAAVLALHKDQEATLETIAEHEGELNGVFQSSRLLVEFAICECRATGGRPPGRLDMSQLMAKVMLLASLGGWSDAIRWGAMEPRLRITPLGDIHANMDFRETILAPYARVGSDLTVKDSVESYAENLKDAEIVKDGSGDTPAEFWDALAEQFGVPFAAVRYFVDSIENFGMERREAIFRIKRSELIAELVQDASFGPDVFAALLETFTFKTRPDWRTVPTGCEERDRFPWRFRRRLSMLRLPLLQLEETEDPELVVVPGIVRDALAYMVRNYHRGDFPLRQLAPKMKKWAGTSRDRLGHEFALKVAERLEALGWKTEVEVPVPKLLQKGFAIDYGDVDVLAWRADTGRVLLIECKDVQHRKTEGEVAEQLADFRGELTSDGKPDLLLRHLNRVAIILEHSDRVAKYVGVPEPRLEGHLVFKNPVPMAFAWSQMEKKLPLHIFPKLDKI